MVGFTNDVSITINATTRIFTANGIPNHTTGQFPNNHNPHAIKPQQYQLAMPITPQELTSFTAIKQIPLA